MKFRINLITRLIFGFGIVGVAIYLSMSFINRTLKESLEMNSKISNVYVPSANNLKELSDMIVNSKMLIKNWVYIEKKQDTPDKLKLIQLHERDVPDVHKKLTNLSTDWTPFEQEEYQNLYFTITDTLFDMHNNIMAQLNSFDSYNDPFLFFDITPQVEEGGEIIALSDSIIVRLHELTAKQDLKVTEARVEMNDKFSDLQTFIIMIGVVLIILSVFIAFFLTKLIIGRINKIKGTLLDMAKGILPTKKMKTGKDEIGDMSAALNELVDGLKEITQFSVEIGKGNFDHTFNPLSEEDALGKALLDMRHSLVSAGEQEAKRRKEDDQRNWAASGIAKFSDLLRQDNDDVEKLTYNIISHLVKYCDANQGGLFLVNDDDERNKFIELKAAYAFNRQKFMDKQIDIGVGLVGRCVQESETIFMTEIPNDYIKITSGLGDENPRCLLIVPLKLNDEVYGVIELASFKLFEKYQIDFIEKIGENVAATLSTVKVNIKTNELLEKSQQQAEEMAAQEEEMRQNMEELQATQEESARRESELEKKVEEFESLKKTQEDISKKLGGDKLSGNLLK